MALVDDRMAEMVGAVIDRTDLVVEALRTLDDEGLRAPSALPGWERLTIACHLRYGAEALADMTRAALAGERASYYPEGRDRQRPATLRPRAGESPTDVVRALATASGELHDLWRRLGGSEWTLEVVEPDDNPDLGRLPLARLPLLRLTEAEVHGGDLEVGLDQWSEVFVDTALPFRLEWLNARRSNHRHVDEEVEGRWLLVATDGPCYRVAVNGGVVESRPASRDAAADAVIEASSRDLLAVLLGRPPRTPPRYRGDTRLALAFNRAFPGP